MSDCRHCYRVTKELTISKKCSLLQGNNPFTQEFFSIKEGLEKRGRTHIPNGECFWDDEEMKDCPCFNR